MTSKMTVLFSRLSSLSQCCRSLVYLHQDMHGAITAQQENQQGTTYVLVTMGAGTVQNQPVELGQRNRQQVLVGVVPWVFYSVLLVP